MPDIRKTPTPRSKDGDANKRTTDQYDSPWKEVVELFFENLTALLFPAVHARIDWSYPYESLEQELREVIRGAAAGPRAVDKLIKVRTLSGKPLYVFVHIEIQVSHDSEFASQDGGQPRDPRRRRPGLAPGALRARSDGLGAELQVPDRQAVGLQ